LQPCWQAACLGCYWVIGRSCMQVFNELPLEFAAEVNELMSLKLEGSVG
jgi:Fe-S cluster assembly protein SufB